MVIFDTDVLIEWFKGNSNIQKEVDLIEEQNICITKITVLEMYIGALNKIELRKIEQNLNQIPQLELSDYIINYAVDLVFNFKLSSLLNK